MSCRSFVMLVMFAMVIVFVIAINTFRSSRNSPEIQHHSRVIHHP